MLLCCSQVIPEASVPSVGVYNSKYSQQSLLTSRLKSSWATVCSNSSASWPSGFTIFVAPVNMVPAIIIYNKPSRHEHQSNLKGPILSTARVPPIGLFDGDLTSPRIVGIIPRSCPSDLISSSIRTVPHDVLC